MNVVVSIDDFVSAPVGRALLGDSWLYFCPRATLFGFVIWGSPTEADVVRLTRALEAELGPPAVPHVSLVDVRRVDSVDSQTFAVFADYVGRHTVELNKMVTRLALVRSPGYVGALAEGFFRVLEPPYPVKLFEAPEDAMTWVSPPGDPELVAELEELLARGTGVSPILRALRVALDNKPGKLSLSSAARELAQSKRTLQRHLQDLGTSYRQEIALSQVRVAMRLLRESDANVERIAYDVGCSTQAHFSALFKRHVGDAPTAWRARQRNTVPPRAR